MVHTFEEVRTRTPADPNEAAREAIMPQAAWEAYLRDAVQGLCPPYTPQALRQWLQATHPQAWAVGAPSPPHPSRQPPGAGVALLTAVPPGDRALTLPQPLQPFALGPLWLYATAGVGHRWALQPATGPTQ